MTMKRKICVITGSRAEYGLLYWLMKELQEDPDVQLQVVVTGAHLSSQFGFSHQIIEADGFSIDSKVEMPLEDDSSVSIAKSVGIATAGFADAYASLEPDMVVVLGDRFEILAAATAAVIMKVPIAHIHGGESTEGAFDELIRHATTKMALLHFTAAAPYQKNIIQMGENPERVFCVGAPGLDHLERTPLLSLEALEKSLNFSFGKPTFLVTFHPVTLEKKSSQQHIEQLMIALDAFHEAKIIFTGANADPDNLVIQDVIDSYVQQNSSRATRFISLGQQRYLSTLKYIDVVIGNSSSGIIEAPSLKKPTVNIGDRQKGRLMADSIIQCRAEAKDIEHAIQKALSSKFQEQLATIQNPYKFGNASLKIKNILKEFPLEESSLKKEFYHVH